MRTVSTSPSSSTTRGKNALLIIWSEIMALDLGSMFDYAFFQRAIIGGLCSALLCSIIGIFVVLRRQALIG
ncbi:MAG: metal ABC transporter permease, partial [Methanomassiliicoccales archaeon]